MLELDVVISQDQQVVVSHEPWLAAHLGRGPSGELIDPRQEQTYNLYQMPYATIRRCVVGEWPNPAFPGQQPLASYRPLLREVLAATEAACQLAPRPPVGYSVELKSTPAGDNLYHPQPLLFAELVLAELAAAGVLPRTTLLSFDRRLLQAARRLLPRSARMSAQRRAYFARLSVRAAGLCTRHLWPRFSTAVRWPGTTLGHALSSPARGALDC